MYKHVLFTNVEKQYIIYNIIRSALLHIFFVHVSAFVYESNVEFKARKRKGMSSQDLKQVLHVSACVCSYTHACMPT